MTDISNRLESLSPQKRALFEQLLQERKARAAWKEAAIPRQPAGASAPLSFAQHRLWFFDRLQPGSAAYNVAVAYRLKGELNIGAIVHSLSEITRRHEILRARFTSDEGNPKIIVEPPAQVAERVVDVSSPEEALRHAEEEARKPFDLAREPLLRALVLRSGPRDHTLVLNVHHIVSDGWSIGILVRELTELYAAFVRGRNHVLPELPIQYTDYATWQHSSFGANRLEPQLAYWRRQLQDPPPTLRLLTDKPRPPLQTCNGAKVFRTLSGELKKALQTVGERYQATLFMTMLAAYHTLLHRITGDTDIVIGSPTAGRDRTEIEPLIGFFVNMLPLRGDLAGDPTFGEMLRRIRDVTLNAYGNQDVPLEKLVQELNIERHASTTPLFQVVFAMFNASPELTLPGLECTLIELDSRTAKFDLTFEILEQPNGLFCSLEYNADLFSEQTAARMLSQYECLLKSIVENSEERISSLRLMDEGERGRILTQLAGRRTEYPREAGVGDVFAEQAAARAEAIAVEYGQQRLTYGELERRANQVARYLIRRGLKRGELVGVYLDRSVELIVALLGIVKAGGAYVPLDTGYPAERVGWMVEDTATRWVLTEGRLRERVSGAEPVVMDDAGMAEESGEAIRGMAGGGDLAYVMYTSGSTGKPKGVCVPHRAIVRLVRNTDFMELGPEQTFLQFAPVSFDASTLEIWGPLLNGGRLVVYAGGTASLVELGRTIRQHGVNALWLTAGLFRVMIENHAEWLSGVRQLLAGGDALSVAHVEKALRELPECRLINGYGPTENTTFTSCYTVERSRMGQWVTIPIGRPIANTEVYVLDGRGEPVPVGVPGEVYAGGEGLALGYWRRPELTAERFVENPFRAGERMYRTGDLGRWLSDGTIEFLGRTDRQVKVRGYRIEPGEIEVAVREAAGVGECAVVVREDRPGDKRLVAYVVGRGGAEIDRGQLQRQLRERLPEYMVPAAVVVLAAMPLTVNGKLDREALPAPAGAGERAAGESGAAPRGELERQIAAVWAEALGVERVGREENFFEMGGHSLLLIQVHARLAEVLGRELAIVDLFRYPTVSALTGYVSGEGGESGSEAGARERERRQSGEREPIAIVAMAGRFPGAGSVEQLWANLRGGVESIRAFTEEELKQAGAGAEIGDADYVKAGTVLEGAELFDAQYFGFNPREAEITDPQHRLFLECAHEALERGGYDPWRYEGRIGVFGGATASSYLSENLGRNEGVKEWAGPLQLLIGNDKDFVPTRVAYKLNLRGPAVNVQTACSTSLVAVHMACESLLRGECEMALAGGVSVRFPQPSGYRYQAEGIMSPDGHCRAFDEEAQGTVGGNGAGVVLLKRLSAAEADGDAIEAVILGSAINNDGANKVGYTAPSVAGQAAVIRAAQAAAGVEAGSIGCIEAHGTGTNLGDPIEIAALKEAFAGVESGQVAVASVKTNLGHLDAAAGVTGLIKAALQVRHGEVVPSLHFRKANPKLGLEGSPFYVNTELRSWTPEGERRAGVSSFGIGGTNAHVVLGEAPARRPVTEGRPWQVLTLSAKTETALETATAQLRAYLGEQETANLADVAWTLQVGRTAHPHRRVALCRGREDALAVLDGQEPQRLWTGRTFDRPSLVFMFPGQGSQHAGMGRCLYETEPVYRAEVDRCSEYLKPQLSLDLRDLLLPGPNGQAAADELLRETRLTQPALFVTEYALAILWKKWCGRPEAMIGHSIGEYVAACLAGVLSVEQALELVALRGMLMQRMPKGSMLSVPLAEDDVYPLLNGSLSLSSVNAPNFCVVGGPAEAIEALERKLAERNVTPTRLRTSHAFHSSMMDPIIDEFAARVARFRLEAPSLPYISNVTGTWITAAEATNPGYWANHLRQPVRFSAGIRELLKDNGRVFLEVGPHHALSTLVRKQAPTAPVYPSLGPAAEAGSQLAQMMQTAGRLWLSGIRINWEEIDRDQQRARVLVPTYPFERQKFWVEPNQASVQTDSRPKKLPLDQWFYEASWTRSQTSPVSLRNLEEPVLAFSDDPAEAPGCICVRPGDAFARITETEYTIRPSDAGDYRRLWAELKLANRRPKHIVHLWASSASGGEAFDRGFHSVLFLLQAMSAGDWESLTLTVVTTGACDVTGEEHLIPENAALIGLCRSIPLEFGGVECRLADFAVRPRFSGELIAELVSPSQDVVTAYRGRYRWNPVFQRISLPHVEDGAGLRAGGVYLIAGASGGIGRDLARYLARSVHARLALIARSAVPPEFVAALEDLGAEVLAISANVADAEQMRAAVDQTIARFGAIDGVIYAAGLQVERKISEISPSECQRQMSARVDGLDALKKALAGRTPQFCCVISSLSSILGVFGFGAYAAAHTFADAFAAREGRTWNVINLDNWLTSSKAESLGLRERPEFLMQPDEGLEVLRRIFAARSSYIVSTGDIDLRRRRWTKPQASPADHQVEPASSMHARPALRSQFTAPRNEAERTLAGIWQNLLGIEQIGVHDNFFEMGGDSVLSIQVVARANQSGLRLSPKQVFELQTIAELAAAAGSTAMERAEQGTVEGAAPLTPIQHWFFEKDFADPHWFNQTFLFETEPHLDSASVREALEAVVSHHDALRLRYTRTGGLWQQENVPATEGDWFTSVNLSDQGESGRIASIERISDEMQRSMDLGRPPLLRAVFFVCGHGRRDRLLLAVHHLVIDLVSWRILLEDIQTACTQVLSGKRVELGLKTTSFRDWTRRLAAHSQSGAYRAELSYWTDAARRNVPALPRDYPGNAGNGSVESARIVCEWLSHEDTRALLHEVPSVYNTQINDVLLTALLRAFEPRTASRSLLVDVEGLGRDAFPGGGDLSRTVGWFTTMYPALLQLPESAGEAEALQSIKEQLRRVPNRGIGYGALRYLDQAAVRQQLAELPAAEISFLYQGQSGIVPGSSGALLVPAKERTGSSQSPRAQLAHLIAVNAAVVEGALRCDWVYSQSNFRDETIRGLAAQYIRALRQLVRHCQSPQAGGFTASDFVAAKMSQKDYAGLLDKLQRRQVTQSR